MSVREFIMIDIKNLLKQIKSHKEEEEQTDIENIINKFNLMIWDLIISLCSL